MKEWVKQMPPVFRLTLIDEAIAAFPALIILD
jgi:hypothetical protein